MTKNITKDTFPYIITILFGVLGWSITHVVDRLVESPLVEYQTSSEKDGTGYKITYKIKNITRNNSFEETKFYLSNRPDTLDKIYNNEATPKAPMMFNYTPPEEGRTYYSYTTVDFQPGCEIDIYIWKDSASIWPIRCSDNEPIQLVTPSWQTFLLKNEFGIIGILSLIFLVIIIIYICK